MLNLETLPTSNFTVDSIVGQGHERKDVVLTLQRMEKEGKGQFIIGRRGMPSRFIWKTTEKASALMAPILPPPLPQTSTPEPPHQLDGKRLFERLMQKVATPIITNKTEEQEVESTPIIIPVPSCQDQLKALAHVVGYKGVVSLDSLLEYLDGVMRELYSLRENTTIEKPAGLDNCPVAWLKDEGVSFWDPDQRATIAKELLAYRKGE